MNILLRSAVGDFKIEVNLLIIAHRYSVGGDCPDQVKDASKGAVRQIGLLFFIHFHHFLVDERSVDVGKRHPFEVFFDVRVCEMLILA